MNDLVEYSSLENFVDKNVFIAFVFNKSPARTFSTALSIAKKAHYYKEVQGGTTKYVAAFRQDQEGAKNAHNLFQIIKGRKSLKILTREGLQSDLLRVSETLNCYKNSFTSNAGIAYCQKDYKILPSMKEVTQSISNLGGKDLPQTGFHTLPCKLLYGFALTERSLIEHPDPQENLLHTAIQRSCIWCPNFNMNNYIRVYTREEVQKETTLIEKLKNLLRK
ncbi:MAG: hypothetical protein WDA09_00355 [Bacteriovoracaceae bacterium]